MGLQFCQLQLQPPSTLARIPVLEEVDTQLQYMPTCFLVFLTCHVKSGPQFLKTPHENFVAKMVLSSLDFVGKFFSVPGMLTTSPSLRPTDIHFISFNRLFI